MPLCARVVEKWADGRHQLAQALDLVLVGLLDVAEQLDEALVHDLLGEHLLLVELADEADVAEHPLLRAHADQLLLLLGRVLAQRLQLGLDHILLLKLLLALVEQQPLEGDGLAARVVRVVELGEGLGAARAERRVHRAEHRLGERLVEDVVDDADHVGARLDGQLEELAGELVELLGGELVEDGLAVAPQLLARAHVLLGELRRHVRVCPSSEKALRS
mmetsp:Transcript_22778/g.66988  ORF Transcript_22778/g.66988 Transcript_22778/m.66988 type:complete len:219 (-) Transcript_22778:315-971(-)